MAYTIYSIGHSNKPIEQFITELKENNIELLVDLRTQPYSRYVPQFNRENLKASLEDEGLKYLFFGDKLGGRPPEGIEAFIASKKFSENVTELLSKIQNKSTALMCSEADYQQCHRRFIIKEIEARGINATIIGKASEKHTEEKDAHKSKQMSLGEY